MIERAVVVLVLVLVAACVLEPIECPEVRFVFELADTTVVKVVPFIPDSSAVPVECWEFWKARDGDDKAAPPPSDEGAV